MRRTALLFFGAIALAGWISGCQPAAASAGEADPWFPAGHMRYVRVIYVPDGDRRIRCVLAGGNAVAVSCEWPEHRAEVSPCER